MATKKYIMMRSTFLKKMFFNLSSAFMTAFVVGCEEWPDDTGFEIDPYSESKFLVNTVNGITYEFYMLNEKGERTTVFNQGEDFTFCFYVTNNCGHGIIYDVDYYQPENGLFTVYDYYGNDYGSANRRYGKLGVDYYMEPGWRWGVESQWIALAYEIHDYDDWIKFFPNPNKREPLPRGDYYTEFTYAFKHTCGDQNVQVASEPLTFRINFKII